VACGSGRNAFWLARRGIDVLGVDRSETAVREAAERAGEIASSARFAVWDLEAQGLPPGPWGAVIVFHYLDRARLPALAESLADGGLLAYKTHLSHPLRGPEAHPRRSDYLLRPAELLHAFRSLTVLDYREWAAPGHAYAALLARKAPPHSR
jgi:SAM-dependent methyltransferase